MLRRVTHFPPQPWSPESAGYTAGNICASAAGSEVKVKAKHQGCLWNGHGSGGARRLLWGQGTYPGWTVGRATPGKQQPDDVQVVVVDGHVQRGQAALQEGDGQGEP